MTPTITTLGAIFLLCLVCSMLLFAVLLSDSWWLALTMALAAVFISVMGLTGRTPLGPLPDIAWSWSNDSFLISLRLGSAFIAPLVLALVALAMLLIRNKRRPNEAN